MAAAKGGEHLPPLLERLLDLGQPPAASVAEALRRRLSAEEVVLEPFLNTAAEREHAQRAREAASAERREVRWEAAQRQRELDEQQETVARSEAALREEERSLEAARQLIAEQEREAQALTMQTTAQVSAAEEQRRRAEAEVAQRQRDVQQQQQLLGSLRAEERAWRSRCSVSMLWLELADDCSDEAAVRAFFARRQPTGAGGAPLRIAEVVKVENPRSLRAFAKSGGFDIRPLRAFGPPRKDTLLFHGCPQEAATNIQAEGLSLQFAGSGMLGRGLYGAPDPRKSLQYCRTSNKFMFIARYNLTGANHAGPTTQHRNSVFDEFCVYDETHVVVLWMVKLA